MSGKRRRQHPNSRRTVVIIVVSVLVVAAIGVGAYLYFGRDTGGSQVAGESGDEVVTSVTAAKPADPDPVPPELRIQPLGNSKKVPTKAGMAKALQPVLAEGALGGTFAGQIMDPASETVLWGNDAGTPQIPASTTKLLTGAALLTSVQDPNSRLVTKVVKGDEPGDIVFVGGGDVTLSAASTGVTSVYDGAPTVADLAQQVKDSGVDVKRIVLDTSYWTGPELAQGWKNEDIRGSADVRVGYITRMQPLMVDGDREDPATENSVRTGEPAQTAGKALARALGDANLPLVEGTAPPEAEVLGEVKSQPLTILLSQALVNSDNVLAEALAREVAIANGAPPSFEGATAATVLALDDLGIDVSSVELYDGSGMSENNRLSAAVLTQVLAKAVTSDKPVLKNLLSGLAIAGVNGTLAADSTSPRFDDDRSKSAAGWVRGKTGSLNSTQVLAGFTPDVDGRVLVFSIISNAAISGSDIGSTRAAQDWMAAIIRSCGCQG